MRFFKKKDVSAAFQGAQQIAENLESLRESILDLIESQKQVERLPVDEQTALDRVEDWVRQQANDVTGQLSPSTFGQSSQRYRFPKVDLSAAVAKYLAPQVEVAMKDAVSRFYQTTTGLSESERSRRLDDIDRQILDLELAEESIIREAEKYGMTLQRREDADPRAVLAHDSALP